MTPILTIAIPTRDRNVLVRDHVGILLPQLTPAVQLVVFDNSSAKPIVETLADLLTQYPDTRVRVTRHPTNIGSSANIMRCLETCETQWLWILGDDDRPFSDAIVRALGTIKCHEQCTAINFSSMHSNGDQDFETSGLEEFLRRMPNFANLTLISNNIYNVSRLAPHVRTGYFFAYSLYPHLACLLSELNTSGGKCCFSAVRLVEWGPQSQWSRIMAGVGMGVLLDLPLPAKVRRILVPHLIGVSGRFSSLTIQLLDQVGTLMDAPTARFLHDQAWHRLYRHNHRLWDKVMRWLGKAMLWTPRLSASMYVQYRKLRGNPRDGSRQDEMCRM
jgi:hypothetical protein